MGALYQLISPSGKRYIGITTLSPRLRFARHRNAARTGVDGALYRAVRRYGFDSFEKKVLLIADDREYLCEMERRLIKRLRSQSPHGYNQTAGGEGFTDLDPVVRAANKVKLRLAWADPARRAKRLEKSQTPEAREIHRAAVVKFTSDPEYRKAKSVMSRQSLNRPEVKAKISATALAMHADPEFKERHRAAMKAVMADPDRRARIAATMRLRQKERKENGLSRVSPEVRAKISATVKALWQDPEYKANFVSKMKNASPETCAKRDAALKKAQAVQAEKRKQEHHG